MMKTQQAFNTIVSILIASWFAEWADAKLAGDKSQIAQVQLALTVVIGGVLSYGIEFARALALDMLPPGRLPRIYKLLGGTLLALVLTGCNTVPTSSEGQSSDKGSVGKGGTISCSEGFTATLGPDGTIAPTCAKNLVWADPPTAEETTGLTKAIEGVMKPFEILAAAIARLIPGGAD